MKKAVLASLILAALSSPALAASSDEMGFAEAARCESLDGASISGFSRFQVYISLTGYEGISGWINLEGMPVVPGTYVKNGNVLLPAKNIKYSPKQIEFQTPYAGLEDVVIPAGEGTDVTTVRATREGGLVDMKRLRFKCNYNVQ